MGYEKFFDKTRRGTKQLNNLQILRVALYVALDLTRINYIIDSLNSTRINCMVDFSKGACQADERSLFSAKRESEDKQLFLFELGT